MKEDYVSQKVLESILRDLEFVIMRTPTGDTRNALCDAQILLMKAKEELS